MANYFYVIYKTDIATLDMRWLWRQVKFLGSWLFRRGAYSEAGSFQRFSNKSAIKNRGYIRTKRNKFIQAVKESIQ
jgi:hypothetical protein